MKHIHFMGIAGSGASACAAIAKAYGYKVSGCDISPTEEFTQGLKDIPIQKGHDPSHLNGTDFLVITPAITSLDPDNPELIEAKNRKIKVLTWQQFLGRNLAKGKFVIAVCGTHGKSTTTAMIGTLLEDAGFDPTVILGANVSKWGANFRIGKPVLNTSTSLGVNFVEGYFVVEADEYYDNFLSLTPDISVVTNIDFDHPEYFEDFTSYKRSFQNFLHKTKKHIIANLGDEGSSQTLMEEGASFGMFFKPIIDYSKTLIDFSLKVPGQFNILNASAAFQASATLGINPKIIQKSLSNFSGIGRRMEYLGEFKGAKVYSDFGHHPTEIKVTIEALREKFPDKKIWLIYQPHMFTRTKALFDDFVKVFKNLPVDKIYILDIYASREVDTGVVNSKQLVEAIGKDSVVYVSQDQASEEIKKTITVGDIIIFMGAGDIDQLARELVESS